MRSRRSCAISKKRCSRLTDPSNNAPTEVGALFACVASLRYATHASAAIHRDKRRFGIKFMLDNTCIRVLGNPRAENANVTASRLRNITPEIMKLNGGQGQTLAKSNF